jgi:hypothetical protein
MYIVYQSRQARKSHRREKKKGLAFFAGREKQTNTGEPATPFWYTPQSKRDTSHAGPHS